MSHFALSALQQPTGLAYTTDGVRIDPSCITRSTQLGRTKPLAGPENTAVLIIRFDYFAVALANVAIVRSPINGKVMQHFANSMRSS
jgi:hypothetical protein